MAKRVKIGDFLIGDQRPPFIIAEAGINHNGELKKAFAMIRLAKQAGADAVKFQTFKAVELVGNPNLTYTYISRGKKVTESMLEMFRRCEFSFQEWRSIKKQCNKEGILFLSSPQNRSDLEILLRLGVPAVKVGSDDFTNIPLLKDYVSTGLPLLLSAGMADLGEVRSTLASVGALRGYPTVLLVCTSQYPTPPEDANLFRLRTLSRAFPGIPLGFSDHTQGVMASCAAVALGACLFEKHFTMDHNLPGPDHWYSEDPVGLRNWVAAIRSTHLMLGTGLVKPSRAEEKMRLLARRSVTAIRDIREGEMLTSENVGLRKPGTGLPAVEFSKVLGKRVKKNISNGTLIRWTHCDSCEKSDARVKKSRTKNGKGS